MEIVEKHAQAVRELAANTKYRFMVVSPWILPKPLKAIIDTLEENAGDATLDVVFRWPQRGDTPALLPKATLRLLLHRDLRSWVNPWFVNGPLHAKVYASETQAIVTSANLTGQGMGSADGGNLELGILTAKQVDKIRSWVRRLPRQPFRPADLKHLEGWYAEQVKAPPAPPTPKPQSSRLPAIADAVERVVASGLAGSAFKIIGEGPGLYELEKLNKTRPHVRTVKVQTSDAPRDRPNTFHFRLDGELLDAWKVRRGRVGHVGGLLLVPILETDVGGILHPDAPVVLLPFEHVFDRNNGVLRSGLKKKAREMLLLREDGQWLVVVPNAKGPGTSRGSAEMAVNIHSNGVGFTGKSRRGKWPRI